MALCNIVIESETNCKIVNLDPATRKKLSKKFSYDIPGARYTPAARLGRWDGKKTFFSLSAQTYVNLLPEILPILVADGYEIDLTDQRTYSTQFEFDKVHESSYSHIKWPVDHERAGEDIVLRDYQVEAINTFLTNIQNISSISTAAGKTIITGVLSSMCEKYGRTIVIVPSKDLVRQTEADYINMGLDVGVLFGDRKDYYKTHTICTWQSLSALNKNSISGESDIHIKEFIDGVVCVIVDECHAAKSAVLTELLCGPLSKIPIRWGVTGTIPKEEMDRRSLQVAIGEMNGTIRAVDLQSKGVLSNCHVHIKQLIDYVEYKNYQDELKYLLSSNDRIAYIAKIISEIRKTGNTLVLIDRVEPGKQMASMITDAVFLSGATKSKTRKENYDLVATNDNLVLIASYGIASTGINIPRIFNLVLIEPGKSFVRVIQSIGRGLRKADDKDAVEIYDITSTCKFAKRHLTTRKKYYNESSYPFTINKVDWQAK